MLTGMHPYNPRVMEKEELTIRNALAVKTTMHANAKRACASVLMRRKPHVFVKHGQWIELRMVRYYT